MVKTFHSAGIEVILDVVYNHTGEGNHLGPTLSLRGIDNRAYYRLEQQPALLHGLHRHGQQPQHAAPAHDPAHHGFAALLGERHARRRLPVRSRAGARARAARCRPAVGVLRHHPSRSDAGEREADRRAVGRRPGRLSGRQLSDSLGGVERQVPRHRSALLARRRRAGAGARVAPRRARATSTSRADAARTRA